MITGIDAKVPSQPTNLAYTTARKRLSMLSDLLVFGVGLLSAIFIDVGGNLYLAEILLLVLLPYLLRRRKSLLRFVYARRIILFGVGWLLSQILTDIYRGTSAADILKGWALIAVLLTNILALYLLLFPSPRRITLSLLGFAIGLTLQPILQPIGGMLVNAWKFGQGFAIILIVSILGGILSKNDPPRIRWWSVILVALAIYSIVVYSSRSLGGTTLLAAFVIWFRFTRFGRVQAYRIKNPIRILLSVVLVAGFGWCIIQVYGYVAEHGYLGLAAQNEYEIQSQGNFGILLGGRREWLVAMHALQDSPFIGYGSYARNTKYGQYLYELSRLGYDVNDLQIENYLALLNSIPTHSHILQGWVWAGLVGGIFWLFILVFMVRGMVMAFRYPSVLFIPTMFMGFSSFWDILFSPLTNIGRLHWAFTITVLLYAMVYKPVLAKKTSYS